MQFIEELLKGYGAVLAQGGSLLLEMGHELSAFNRLVDEDFRQLPVTWLETESGEQAVVSLAHPG
jgi:hypothetical protein